MQLRFRIARAVFMVALAAMILAPNAYATTTVDVTLDLSALQPLATVPYKSCDVTVNEGADGVAVLQAAKDAHCIKGYKTDDFGFGLFVRCIDRICGTDATYWRMTENGDYTSYGVSDFSADDQDVLGFSYTQWATCLVELC